MTKITKRDMYGFIKAMANGVEFDCSIEDIVDFCNNELAALDRRATKSKERAAARKKDSDVLTEAVYNSLDSEEYKTLADLVEALSEDYPDVTTAKISSRMGNLIKAEMAEKTEVSVPAVVVGTKPRRLVAYRAIG